jgi:hypothetical protein
MRPGLPTGSATPRNSYLTAGQCAVTRRVEQGLDVKDLEDDSELQDMVLSVHHSAMLTLSGTASAKLVENHHGRAWIQAQQVFALQGQIPVGVMPGAPGAPGAPIPTPAKKPPPPPPRKRNKGR